MAALSADRNIWRRDGQVQRLPVKAGARIFKGALVCTSGGLAVPAADSAGLRFAGVAMEQADNRQGADSVCAVRVWQSGVFPMARPNALLQDVGLVVAVADDQTVQTQEAATNDVLCGRIVRVSGADEVELKIDGYAF